MATILSSGTLADYPITSRIGNVTVHTTDESPLDVALAFVDGNARTEVFRTRLYPFDTYATVYDMSSIIEEDMRKRGVFTAEYILRMGDASATVRPIYCEAAVTGGDADLKNLLLSDKTF